MSGIAGIVRFDGAPIEPGLIESMTSAMAHRGPDGIHHWTRGSVALGQCMLCTTPESLEEKQPLTNEDQSLVLVMDGRLDNWQELRRELSGRGAMLRNRSDAELALRAYEAWGRECLAHLDGDFALAIWDARRHAVFCARDRMGMKPFNYHWDGKTLTFASELHAILGMPWVSRELNEGMLVEYLSVDWLSHDETPWKGIHRLVEAHWMETGPNGMQSGQYWRPDLHSPLVYRRDEEYAEHYRALFADSVRRASRSHRPLACEVSGGLDSSAVFAVAADLQRQQTLLAPGLSGFTLDFDDDSAANELDYARAVGAHLGLPVQEIEPTTQPLSWYREQARMYREFPGYPNGVMGWGIKEAARAQDCRVLLNGTGGDEWLTGGRHYYVEELAARRWRNLLGCISADLRAIGAKQTWGWLMRSCAVVYLPSPVQDVLRILLRRIRPPAINLSGWLEPDLREIARQRKSARDRPVKDIDFTRAGQVSQYRTLNYAYDDLARETEERHGAIHGIENRQPLWSTAMVQFAFATPDRLRLRGTTDKALHRRAMRGLLPASVLERTSKADFGVTFARHAADLQNAFSAEMLQNRKIWVLRQDLKERCRQFGNVASDGATEWMLWNLFGWRMLQTGADA